MVKACLFDLDGVVFDTEPLYTLFWKEIGEQFCPNVPNFEYVIKGQTLVQIYDKYLTYSSFCRMESSLTTDIHWCSQQFKRFRDISTFEIVQ